MMLNRKDFYALARRAACDDGKVYYFIGKILPAKKWRIFLEVTKDNPFTEAEGGHRKERK